MKSTFIILLLSLGLPPLVRADLLVDPGLVKAGVGATSINVPIMVSGGDAITDMAGLVEVGNPPAAGPTITGISYTGSIWNNAPGGFDAFQSIPMPAVTIDPSASLKVSGQSVSGTGLLCTITVNITGLGLGDYPVRLANTLDGDTVFLNGAGDEVPATFAGGIIRIVGGLEGWRLLYWPGDAPNPATELTIWGDNADPDKDGLTNLMEFYFGTNPTVPTSNPATSSTPGRPVLGFTGSPTRYATVSYTRRKALAPLTAELQTSTILSGWSTAGFSDLGLPVNLPGGNYEFITRRFDTAVEVSNPKRFFRFKVENPGT
jgi:hypothetical protein